MLSWSWNKTPELSATVNWITFSSAACNLESPGLWKHVEFCRWIGILDSSLITSPSFFWDSRPSAGEDSAQILISQTHFCAYGALQTELQSPCGVLSCSSKPRPLVLPLPPPSSDGGPTKCATNQTGPRVWQSVPHTLTFASVAPAHAPLLPAFAMSWSLPMN